MGAKRKVDEKLYAKIKKELKTPKDDATVIKKYNLGKTTVRALRNSWCYDDFVMRTTHKKKPVVTEDDYLMAVEDTKVSFTTLYVLMAVIVIGALAMLYLLVRWIFSWFGI